MAVAEEWVKKLENPQMWDQTAFNDLVRSGAAHSMPPNGLFRGYNNKLTVGVLPASVFASGHMFFVQVRCSDRTELHPQQLHPHKQPHVLAQL